MKKYSISFLLLLIAQFNLFGQQEFEQHLQWRLLSEEERKENLDMVRTTIELI